MSIHYLLVDGYNIIHARDELSEIAEYSLHGARQRLCDILSEFKVLSGYTIIVVFDAHLVEGGIGSVEYRIAVAPERNRITVATSDVLEQLIILGRGAQRISADALLAEIEAARENMRVRHIQNRPIKNNPVISLVDEETAKLLEEMRYDKPKPKR
jgi:predicted RNA-binding protein with PIN domain